MKKLSEELTALRDETPQDDWAPRFDAVIDRVLVIEQAVLKN